MRVIESSFTYILLIVFSLGVLAFFVRILSSIFKK